MNRLVRGESIAESLRLAAAAGAMRAAGSPFADWDELQAFADTAPLRPAAATVMASVRRVSATGHPLPGRRMSLVLKRAALAVAAGGVGYVLSELLRA